MIELSDEDLLLRLKNFEDFFVERKTGADSKDWVKTVVAFANSAPIGFPAVLYIGVRDNGTPEKSINLDSLQKTLAQRLQHAYPPIFYVPKVLRIDNSELLAVVVPGSSDRPHFAAPAFVRDGSKSVAASARQFEHLIASRTNKAYELMKWLGRPVSVVHRRADNRVAFGPWERQYRAKLVECNQFYVTVEIPSSTVDRESIPLRLIDIGFDNVEKRLRIEVNPM